MSILVREVIEKEKALYNRAVSHIVQSWEWGEFRKKIGLDLARIGHFSDDRLVSAYQLTFHKVPLFGKKIGYLPKGPMPNEKMVKALADEANIKNAAYIKIEPNVILEHGESTEQINAAFKKVDPRFVSAKKSLFTKYNFLLDLTKSDADLLSGMHPKTRYNIGVAQKKGVEVYESTKEEDFEIYLKLYFETVKRQKYFGHTPDYHRMAWQTLGASKMARLLIAKYEGKPLAAWMLFNFKNTLYYPYGGSSTENKEVMASNLVAWEAIKLGKKMGLSTFDMWGALGPDARESDPWYGFHRFKAGYGPKLVEYVGTFDLVLSPALYETLNIADKTRWFLLRALKR